MVNEPARAEILHEDIDGSVEPRRGGRLDELVIRAEDTTSPGRHFMTAVQEISTRAPSWRPLVPTAVRAGKRPFWKYFL